MIPSITVGKLDEELFFAGSGIRREWRVSSFGRISSGIIESFVSPGRAFVDCFDLALHEGSCQRSCGIELHTGTLYSGAFDYWRKYTRYHKRNNVEVN